MVTVNREVIEANVSAMILSVLENDYTRGSEYVHLQEDLEECIMNCLESHHVIIIGKFGRGI